MTFTLNELIQSLLDVNNFLDTEQRQVTRMISPVLNTSVTIVISATEPYDEPLPMNVVWLDMNRASDMYRKLRQRKSKAPANGLQNTWALVEKIDTVYTAQHYDPSDIPGNTFNVATNNLYGIAQLTTEASDAGRPTFVSTDDPRNFDARDPLEHSHQEKPAREFATKDGKVNITSIPTLRGQTLVAKNVDTAVYDKLSAQELKESE